MEQKLNRDLKLMLNSSSPTIAKPIVGCSASLVNDFEESGNIYWNYSALDNINLKNKSKLIASIQKIVPSFDEIVNTIFPKSNQLKGY